MKSEKFRDPNPIAFEALMNSISLLLNETCPIFHNYFFDTERKGNTFLAKAPNSNEYYQLFAQDDSLKNHYFFHTEKEYEIRGQSMNAVTYLIVAFDNNLISQKHQDQTQNVIAAVSQALLPFVQSLSVMPNDNGKPLLKLTKEQEKYYCIAPKRLIVFKFELSAPLICEPIFLDPKC
jgi:hypothetical protein